MEKYERNRQSWNDHLQELCNYTDMIISSLSESLKYQGWLDDITHDNELILQLQIALKYLSESKRYNEFCDRFDFPKSEFEEYLKKLIFTTYGEEFVHSSEFYERHPESKGLSEYELFTAYGTPSDLKDDDFGICWSGLLEMKCIEDGIKKYITNTVKYPTVEDTTVEDIEEDIHKIKDTHPYKVHKKYVKGDEYLICDVRFDEKIQFLNYHISNEENVQKFFNGYNDALEWNEYDEYTPEYLFKVQEIDWKKYLGKKLGKTQNLLHAFYKENDKYFLHCTIGGVVLEYYISTEKDLQQCINNPIIDIGYVLEIIEDVDIDQYLDYMGEDKNE